MNIKREVNGVGVEFWDHWFALDVARGSFRLEQKQNAASFSLDSQQFFLLDPIRFQPICNFLFPPKESSFSIESSLNDIFRPQKADHMVGGIPCCQSQAHLFMSGPLDLAVLARMAPSSTDLKERSAERNSWCPCPLWIPINLLLAENGKRFPSVWLTLL